MKEQVVCMLACSIYTHSMHLVGNVISIVTCMSVPAHAYSGTTQPQVSLSCACMHTHERTWVFLLRCPGS